MVGWGPTRWQLGGGTLCNFACQRMASPLCVQVSSDKPQVLVLLHYRDVHGCRSGYAKTVFERLCDLQQPHAIAYCWIRRPLIAVR